ncbi:hypothetical protein C0992_007753 [Termitomyces sp. T32_za158]|nr:hypothetical protein C0992_007753 [Termitomyces sp. T32_za158]
MARSYREKSKEKETGMPVVDMQAEAVWRCLIAAGQRVPPESEFLSDPVAQVVITGLLDEIVMLQQHNNNTIKTFAMALKQRLMLPKEPAEAKRLRVSGAVELPMSVGKDGLEPSLSSVALQQQKEAGEITPMLADLYNKLVEVDASLQGLSLSAHAPSPSMGPTTKLDDVDLSLNVFVADVPKGADSSIVNFAAAVQFNAPLSEYSSVVPTINTQSDNNVEGRLPTMALLGLEEPSNVSDYGEQLEEMPSEGETPANGRLQLANKKKLACSAHEAA